MCKPNLLFMSDSVIILFIFIFCVFLKRLKNWEIRERKKSRDYSKDTEREDERRREMVHEYL